MRAYKLTSPELRARLARPLGILVKGPPSETMQKLIEHLETQNPKKLIVVGDVVAANALRHGIHVDVFIVDNRTMRQDIEPASISAEMEIETRNPRSTITLDAWAAIARAAKENRTVKISVDGEEDLLTLPAVISAPVGSLVVYGQPREGIVLVEVTREKKREALSVIDSMEV